MLAMPAPTCYSAGMKKGKTDYTQYTIRNVPARLDAKLREKATEYGQSLNATSLAALMRGVGAGETPAPHHDLDDLSGSWVRDEATDRALDEMRQIDEEMWR